MKNLFAIGLATGFIICLLSIHFVCNQQTAPPTTVDTRMVDSLSRELIIRDNKIITDSLNYEEQRQADDSDRSAWIESKDATERRMAGKISELTFKLDRYRTASLAHDTAQVVINCEGIVQELDSLYLEALFYKKQIDSLQQNATDRRGIDSSELNILRQQIAGDGMALEQMRDKISALVNENADLRRLISRNRKAKWLLMGISAILGGFLVNQAK